jgi:SAM-dependent methyltransferase
VTDATYIHGTGTGEQQRLAALNRLTNAPFVEFLRVGPQMRVLEVGSGLGILAGDVAASAPQVRVTGVERSAAQLAAAIWPPGVVFAKGDAHRLGFPDSTFDIAYARYLLEHVARPADVLREMRRVTRPGGRVAALENDSSLLRIDPPCPAFEEAWAAFLDLQAKLGGDGLIGRRLFRLFRDAGFTKIELSVQPDVHWNGSPGFAAWIENVIGNVAGAREELVASKKCSAARIDQAIAELRSLLQRDDASSHFVWNRAMAAR